MDVNEMGRSWADDQAVRWLYLLILKWALVAVSIVLLLDFVAAHAEDAAPAKKPPDFVPFVVDAQQDAAIRSYLNDMRFKDAAPVIVWLNELEARAKVQWSADNAPKEAPKP